MQKGECNARHPEKTVAAAGHVDQALVRRAAASILATEKVTRLGELEDIIAKEWQAAELTAANRTPEERAIAASRSSKERAATERKTRELTMELEWEQAEREVEVARIRADKIYRRMHKQLENGHRSNTP